MHELVLLQVLLLVNALVRVSGGVCAGLQVRECIDADMVHVRDLKVKILTREYV